MVVSIHSKAHNRQVHEETVSHHTPSFRYKKETNGLIANSDKELENKCVMVKTKIKTKKALDMTIAGMIQL